MQKIYIILGKTLSGKTTLQNKLIEKFNLDPIVISTTRPKRINEVDHKDYHFVNDDYFNEQIKKSNIVFERSYKVSNGDIWRYFLTKNELFKNSLDKILIVDYTGYEIIKLYIETEKLDIKLIPIYLDIDLKTRLSRLINSDRFNEDNLEILRRLYKDELAFKDVDKDPNILKITDTNNNELIKIFKPKLD